MIANLADILHLTTVGLLVANEFVVVREALVAQVAEVRGGPRVYVLVFDKNSVGREPFIANFTNVFSVRVRTFMSCQAGGVVEFFVALDADIVLLPGVQSLVNGQSVSSAEALVTKLAHVRRFACVNLFMGR